MKGDKQEYFLIRGRAHIVWNLINVVDLIRIRENVKYIVNVRQAKALTVLTILELQLLWFKKI